jgi:OOP family OmpA-OmpF porin
MRTTVSLLSSLLFIWISISSYIYVCKIRKDCIREKTLIEDPVIAEAPDSEPLPAPKVEQAVPMPPLHTIFFEFNKSQVEITPESLAHFESIKSYLGSNAGRKVLVTGHSDNVGSDIAKEQVGLIRADFIAQKLAGAGIPSTTIEVRSESDKKPIGDNSTREGRAKNRRVEIIIQ